MLNIRKHLQIDPIFIINIAVLLFMFVFGKHFFYYRLNEITFQNSSFLLPLLKTSSYIVGLTIGLLFINYLPLAKNVLYQKFSWHTMDNYQSLRLLIMLIVFIIGWTYSTYGYNYYYNQAYYLERLLLVILGIAIYFSPIFVAPFVILGFAILDQMTYPQIVAYAYTDKIIVFHVLVLFSCFVYIRPFLRVKTSVFIFLASTLIGSYYFMPGWEKISLNQSNMIWAVDNQLHNLFISSYLNGWLKFLNLEQALQIADIMRFLNIPLQLLTILTELSGIFIILFRRRLAILILLTASMLHIGIVVASGIFFWKWIMLDWAFALYLWRQSENQDIKDMFRLPYAIISMVMIAMSMTLFQPFTLGWYDGPVDNFYDFEVIDTQGNTFEFPRSAFQPYDLAFTQSRFYFLTDDNLISNTYGTIHKPSVYYDLTSGAGVNATEALWGQNYYSSSKIEIFTSFLKTFFKNYNKNHNNFFLPSLLKAPLHINTFPNPNSYDNQYPIQTVRITFTKTLYRENKVEILDQDTVLEVTIPLDE